MEDKLRQIQDAYDKWSDGLISSDVAMALIGKILNRKQYMIKNIAYFTLKDAKTGEVMFSCDNAIVANE